MTEELPTTRSILKSTPWYGYLLVVISFLTGALMVVVLFGLGSRAQRNSTAVTALCVIRGNLARQKQSLKLRVRRTERFVRTHPRGIPGVPVSLIRQELRSDQQDLLRSRRDLKALNILDC